jgi:streptomycin 6-kinase
MPRNVPRARAIVARMSLPYTDGLLPERAVLLDPWLRRWNLVPDGAALTTPSSVLLPVRRHGEPSMLKIATGEEERRGAALMVWWDGEGAARVLAHEGDALLMERAQGESSLDKWAENGRDDEATRILCAAAAKLHAPRDVPPPATLVPLTRWFADLEPAARHGDIFRQSVATASELLAQPRDFAVLHGDIHHGNILDFSPRGWLAIDPKGLLGERGFDFANIFCNPSHEVATAPGRLAHLATLVAETAGLDRHRLLQWILAYAGLSAAWSIEDGDEPDLALAVAEMAAVELDRSSPKSPERG